MRIFQRCSIFSTLTQSSHPQQRNERRRLPCHITTAGENLIVVQEPAAAEIAGVAGQLPGHAHRPVSVLQTEYISRNENKGCNSSEDFIKTSGIVQTYTAPPERKLAKLSQFQVSLCKIYSMSLRSSKYILIMKDIRA